MTAKAFDPVHSAQATFRGLLDALAHPGTIVTLDGSDAVPGVAPSLGATLIALVDDDVSIAFTAGVADATRHAIVAQTGVRHAHSLGDADFVLVAVGDPLPSLETLAPGSAEEPERSATILVDCRNLSSGPELRLCGPGIDGRTTAHLDVPDGFWNWWRTNTERYPLGVDAFVFAGDMVVALARTTVLAE